MQLGHPADALTLLQHRSVLQELCKGCISVVISADAQVCIADAALNTDGAERYGSHVHKLYTCSWAPCFVGCVTQAKFRHFGKVDAAKYSQLWRLQQQEACGLVRQLLAADRVIHEQQLGWQWAPPDEGIFVSPHDVVSQAGPAAAAAAAAAGVATLTINAAGAVEGGEEDVQQQQLHEQQQQQQQVSEAGGRVSQDGAASARSRSSSASSPGGVTGRHNGAAEVRCF
jgi:hypothetical protein